MKFLLEAALVYLFYGLFRILPVKTASAIGGAVFETLCPHFGVSKHALKNLNIAFPEKTEAEKKQILKAMWNHLGRVVAEYPHLKEISLKHTEFSGYENVPQGKPIIFVGGHIGNWETGYPLMALQKDIELGVAYRAPNNPYVDKLIVKIRSVGGTIKAFNKSRKGTAEMFRHLKAGKHVFMLVDQKFNRGEPVPLFGKPAMTALTFIEMARKTEAIIIPFRAERTGGHKSRISFFPAVNIDRPDMEIMREIHAMFEGWIKERPEQWLWLHRRWDSKALKE